MPVRRLTGLALAAAMLLLLAACASSASHFVHAARPSAHPRLSPRPISGKIGFSFSDTATGTKCPRTAPARAQCFLLTASTGTRDFGNLTLGPTLDAEVPAGSTACGKPARYRTSLAGPGGTLAISEAGPRLCLGNVGTVARHFTVTGGTGQYAGAAGNGSITMDVQSVGATETWSGMIHLGRKG
jgi:hypothetical protein